MFQSTEYVASDFFDWYWKVEDFSKIDKGKELTLTNKALSLILASWLLGFVVMLISLYLSIFLNAPIFISLFLILLIPFLLPFFLSTILKIPLGNIKLFYKDLLIQIKKLTR